MTLEQQLQQILDIKQDINEAISQQGVNISQTDAFSSYANKIKSIQGSNTVQNGFSVTDIKITDHILNETETIGWARTGQTIRKTDNPGFYNKCLQEYNESIVGRGYVSANVTLIGDLTEHKGVLSGFVSERSGAKVLKTVPSTVTSFEMVAKVFVSEDHTTYKAIYCQPISTNYITPQFEIGTAGKVQVAVSKSGSSWDYSIQDTERCVGQTLWVKSTLKDGVLSLLKSFDGKNYKLIGSVDNVQGCKWTTGIGVGVDSDNASHALDGGTIDLMECYIDINEERWWTGCETFETREHIDGHKYATIDKQAYIDNYYKKLGYIDYYIIDEEKEQITLLQLIEDECTYIYFCTGTQIKQDIIVDLSKEIELNNPFSFGDSKYSPVALNNLSWLKSAGQWNSKAVYTNYYDWILTNVNAGVKGFLNSRMYAYNPTGTGIIFTITTTNPVVGMTCYGWSDGSYINKPISTITQVNENGTFVASYNGTDYTFERMPSNDQPIVYPSDYDYVINTEEETFRLPLLNGSEDLPSDRYDTLTLKDSRSTYIAPANGWFTINKYSNEINQEVCLINDASGMSCRCFNPSRLTVCCATIMAAKGDIVMCSYSAAGELNFFRFIYAQGNGSLYYFVGETVQNANVIDAGKIQTQLVDKLETDLTNLPQESKSYLTGLGLPSNKYIDLTLGASGTLYTAPANGYIHLSKMATAAHQYFGFNPLKSCNGITTSECLYYTQSTSAQTMAGFIPVRKGEQFFIYYTAQGQVCAFRFIYAEGDQ